MASVVRKASKRLHILHILNYKCSGVPPLKLLRVHFALIRSVVEYCCPGWHSSLSVKLSDIIERGQKRVLRIIYPALHYDEALEISGCTTLHTRRERHCERKHSTRSRSPDCAFATFSRQLRHLHMIAFCVIAVDHHSLSVRWNVSKRVSFL